MADTFKGIITADGKKRQLPYNAVFGTPASDPTLSLEGAFADSKAVGDKFKEVKAETDSLKEDLSNKITKFYASNQGETHITDSDNGKIQDMMVYGKSEQKKYSGRNLMPIFDDFETTVSGVSIKAKNGLITLEGNSIAAIGYSIPLKETITLPDENIYMHLRNNAELAGSSLVFKNENGQVDFASISSINRVLLAPPLTGQPISEIMLSLGEGIAFKGFKMQPSLELTDEATTFEPYTGGQPSPSPDYPQEIKSVVNPTIKVYGKNLFDSSKISNYMNGLTCKKNSDGSITVTGSSKGQVQFIYQTIFTAGTYFISFKSVGKATSGNNISHYVRYREDGNNKYPSNKFTLKQDTEVAIGIYYYDAVTDANQTAWLQIEKGSVATPYEPYKEQSIQLPYTLYAIPVSSGGNVTIDGQQYIADYVDVERGKLVRMVGVADQDTFETSKWESTGSIVIFSKISNVGTGDAIATISSKFTADWSAGDEIHHFTQPTGQTLVMVLPKTITTVEQGKAIRAKGFKFYYILATPIEIDLTEEENAALKELATYYPVTNISINSEQIDGYTIFNYPISMANGWNYVKQQLNDNRDYIYDMDSRTQDIDTQSAEAYVNSEYAVALTELEV